MWSPPDKSVNIHHKPTAEHYLCLCLNNGADETNSDQRTRKTRVVINRVSFKALNHRWKRGRTLAASTEVQGFGLLKLFPRKANSKHSTDPKVSADMDARKAFHPDGQMEPGPKSDTTGTTDSIYEIESIDKDTRLDEETNVEDGIRRSPLLRPQCNDMTAVYKAKICQLESKMKTLASTISHQNVEANMAPEWIFLEMLKDVIYGHTNRKLYSQLVGLGGLLLLYSSLLHDQWTIYNVQSYVPMEYYERSRLDFNDRPVYVA